MNKFCHIYVFVNYAFFLWNCFARGVCLKFSSITVCSILILKEPDCPDCEKYSSEISPKVTCEITVGMSRYLNLFL